MKKVYIYTLLIKGRKGNEKKKARRSRRKMKTEYTHIPSQQLGHLASKFYDRTLKHEKGHMNLEYQN